MQIMTSRFGPLEVEDDSIYSFPEGLPGFEHTRRYCIVPHKTSEGSTSPFKWLQCVDEPELAFPLINPWTVQPDYAPTINGAMLRQVGITDFKEQAQVMAIVTIPAQNPSAITVNLLAPVLINRRDRVGKQVIVQNENYALRTPLMAGPSPKTSARSLSLAAA